MIFTEQLQMYQYITHSSGNIISGKALQLFMYKQCLFYPSIGSQPYAIDVAMGHDYSLECGYTQVQHPLAF
jgi:hypothetical protein